MNKILAIVQLSLGMCLIVVGSIVVWQSFCGINKIIFGF